MAGITQAQAVVAINQMTAFMVQLADLRDSISPYIAAYLNNGVGGIVSNLPTYSINADGTAGASDGSPNAGHPIDPSHVTGLTQPTLTPFQIGVGENILAQFLNLFGGSAVTTEASAPAILDAFRPSA